MSRLKLPYVSWRACRVTSAAATLAALMTAALLTQPADAKPDNPAPKPAHLPSVIRIDAALGTGRTTTLEALHTQASAQAAAHRQAEAAAAAKRRAEARAAAAKRREQARAAAELAQRQADAAAARERTQQQRAARSATRTFQAPTVGGAQSYARSRLSSSQYSCLDSVVRHESGWNHRATNPSSGAYGLMQALPGSKMSSAGSDWRTNPVTQIKWGLSYMNARYGSPCGAWNFWLKNRWY